MDTANPLGTEWFGADNVHYGIFSRVHRCKGWMRSVNKIFLTDFSSLLIAFAL